MYLLGRAPKYLQQLTVDGVHSRVGFVEYNQAVQRGVRDEGAANRQGILEGAEETDEGTRLLP